MDKRVGFERKSYEEMCGIDFFSDVSACYGTGTEGVSD